MSTTFAELSLDEIHAHIHNPRRQAIADPEMVESIKTHGLIEPLIVAPADAGYVLIAGHRRKNGLEQAGIKVAPALIRTDLVTEPLQIEAMLIENGHREDLTPIEEADGYEQLELFGYKPRDIAKATGRSEKTVKARLKLRDLSTATRTKLHEGQVTIHDALELIEFADTPEILAELETAIGSSNFAWRLQQAKDKKAAHVAQMKLRSRVAMEKIPHAEVDRFFDEDKGPFPLTWWPTWNTAKAHLREESEHDGCLAWSEKDGVVHLVCSNPAKHAPAKADTPESPAGDDAAAARREQWEKDRLAREALRLEAEAAARVRVAHAADLHRGAQLPDVLIDLARAVLPSYLVRAHDYGELSDWVVAGLGYDTTSDDLAGPSVDTLLADAATWNRAQVTGAIVGLLIEHAEELFADGMHADSEHYAQASDLYLQWLTGTGHSFCDVDERLRDEVTTALTEDDEDQAEAS